MARNTNHYEIIKTYVTYEDKIYYKNYLCRKDDGQIVKIKKKINSTTYTELPPRHSFEGTLHSFEMLLFTLLKPIIDEESFKIFKTKAKQIDYYIDKLKKVSKNDQFGILNELINKITLKCFDIIKEKAPNRKLLEDAFDYLIKNTELQNYVNFEDENQV